MLLILKGLTSLADASLQRRRRRDINVAILALAAVAFLLVEAAGIPVAAVHIGTSAFIYQLLADPSRPAVRPVHEALKTTAFVALVQINALGILVTVVQMRELALVHHWNCYFK